MLTRNRILRRVGKRYDGPVVYVDGVHYPVGKDGHAIRSRPLRWSDEPYTSDVDPGAHYVYAAPNEASHEHTFHRRTVELEIGTATPSGGES